MSKLPTLTLAIPIVDDQGRPSTQFQRFFQVFSDNIAGQIGALQAAQAAQAAATAANAAAVSANAAATAAGTAAATANATTALSGSYPTGVTLTATDAGASATIAISAHTRVYVGAPSVSVNAGSVTGLFYSTLYYIYYDDPARAGGAVTYAATTSTSVAAQTGNRHVVGSVTTPAALGAPSPGKYVLPPGSGLIP